MDSRDSPRLPADPRARALAGPIALRRGMPLPAPIWTGDDDAESVGLRCLDSPIDMISTDFLLIGSLGAACARCLHLSQPKQLVNWQTWR
ncbi:unnamed protein product [Penicillium bialowiezense]